MMDANASSILRGRVRGTAGLGPAASRGGLQLFPGCHPPSQPRPAPCHPRAPTASGG